ncbi:hypothetical protein [Hymenobacter sp. UYCo722]|uniref:hypothetical protein n=1 Tax=Hymenobacter sp. UYCo722 TaxID=3156335 RepID=UPI0033970954
MESKLSPGRHRAEDAAWSISAGTRQGAREADACMAADDWLYAAPGPLPPGEPRAIGTTAPARPPAH